MEPAIVPNPPGEQPSEPGWYVCDDPRSERRWILELTPYHFHSGRSVLDLYVFVARVFPHRVEEIGAGPGGR